MWLERTIPAYSDAPIMSTAIAEPDREAARARTEHGADGERDEDDRAAAVGHQVKPPQHFAEDRARQQPAVGHLAERNDLEDGRRRDRAKGEQSANPDGNRQDSGEPKHKHSHHYN